MDIGELLLNELELLLSNRGYLEEAIDSADKPGTLLSTLRRNISLGLREFMYDAQPFYFNIKITGFFHGEKYVVTFRLHFRLDPVNPSLSITQLDLSSNGVQKSITLKSSHDLPHTSNAIKLLKELLDIFDNKSTD